jgi:DNA-binding winged helix-turn-helix (wHTH) protein
MNDGARVAFGEFVLDGATRQLLRNGVASHLEPKAFAVLELLVARRPAAVSKADVRDRVWPDTFVAESTLTGLVAQVRRALDDGGPHERYIRTVHGFGYAFVAETAPVASADRAVARDAAVAAVASVARIIWEDKVFALVPGETVIGRGEDSTVCIDHPGISRRHARIVVAADEATLEDLGSKNGTFRGDDRVSKPVPLAEGDAFRVGRVMLVFRWSPSSVATRTEGSDGIAPAGRPVSG